MRRLEIKVRRSDRKSAKPERPFSLLRRNNVGRFAFGLWPLRFMC